MSWTAIGICIVIGTCAALGTCIVIERISWSRVIFEGILDINYSPFPPSCGIKVLPFAAYGHVTLNLQMFHPHDSSHLPGSSGPGSFHRPEDRRVFLNAHSGTHSTCTHNSLSQPYTQVLTNSYSWNFMSTIYVCTGELPPVLDDH